MAALDFIIVLFLILSAFLGWRQGFLVGVVTAAALVGGSVLSARIVPRIMDGGQQTTYTPLIGLAGGLLFAAIIASSMQDIAAWAKERYLPGSMVRVDAGLGSLFTMIIGVALIWLGAATAMSLPAMREVRPVVLQSQIIQRLNAVLPPSSLVLNTISRYDPFPTIRGPAILIDPPDGSLPKIAAVRTSAMSVVRVVGTACGFGVTGSGWVADTETVITNAHVVAGSTDTSVQSFSDKRGSEAKVVHVDSINDIAILRVRGLVEAPLEMASEVDRGTSGAVMGFPENGPFSSKPARIGAEEEVRADDAFEEREVTRLVTTFRGKVRHGNSGGPIVDDQGRVLTTVFASAIGTKVDGGYGIPNSLVREALEQAGSRAVSTGRCMS